MVPYCIILGNSVRSFGDYTNPTMPIVSMQSQGGSVSELCYRGVAASKRAVVDRAKRLESNQVAARCSLEVELLWGSKRRFGSWSHI